MEYLCDCCAIAVHQKRTSYIKLPFSPYKNVQGEGVGGGGGRFQVETLDELGT